MPENRAYKAALLPLAGVAMALAAPLQASEMPAAEHIHAASLEHVLGDMRFDHRRDRHRDWDEDDDWREARHYGSRSRYYDSYGEPIYRNTRIWRGRDGRYYCRKRNGTTGLIIGGAAGALLGREIAGRRGDRTLGAILGAAGGALLGRSIDRSNRRCR